MKMESPYKERFEKAVLAAWPTHHKRPLYLRLHLRDNRLKAFDPKQGFDPKKAFDLKAFRSTNISSRDEFKWIPQTEWKKRLTKAGIDLAMVKKLSKDMGGWPIGDTVGPDEDEEGAKTPKIGNIPPAPYNPDFKPTFRKVLKCAQFEQLKESEKIKDDEWGLIILGVRPNIELEILSAYYKINRKAPPGMPDKQSEKLKRFLNQYKDLENKKHRRKLERALNRLHKNSDKIMQDISLFDNYDTILSTYQSYLLSERYGKGIKKAVHELNEMAKYKKAVNVVLKKFQKSMPDFPVSLSNSTRGGQVEPVNTQVIDSLAFVFDEFSGWWKNDLNGDEYQEQRRTFVVSAIEFCNKELQKPRVLQILREVLWS